jgi:hypothetical protein
MTRNHPITRDEVYVSGTGYAILWSAQSGKRVGYIEQSCAGIVAVRLDVCAPAPDDGNYKVFKYTGERYLDADDREWKYRPQ